MAGPKLVSLFLLCMLVAPVITTTQAAAMTCGQVASSLSPCLNYLKGQVGAQPSLPCCNGVRNINNAAQTTADRRIACGCLKSAAGNIPGINTNMAESLPSKCGVNIPYKISLSTNCNTIK